MPDEQRAQEQPEQPDTPVAVSSDVQRRARLLEQLSLILIFFMALSLISYVFVYEETRAWQVLLDMGLYTLILVGLGRAYWLARRQRLLAAGYWLGGTLFVTAPISGLYLTGVNWFNGLVSLIVIGFVVVIVWPKRWDVWLIVLACFLAYFVGLGQLDVASRYDLSESTMSSLSNWVLTALAVLLVLALIVRTLLQGSIRTRLLFAFVMLVVLPVAITGLVSAYLSIQSSQERALDQLESIATIKEAEIQTWIDNLQTDLSLALAGEEATRRAIELLKGDDPALPQGAYDVVQAQFQTVIERTERFDELFLLDRQGMVVVSTDLSQEGLPYGAQDYFRQGLEGEYLQPATGRGQLSVVVSRPVQDGQSQTLGVLAGFARLDTLSRIMERRAGLGNTGETYLVGKLAGVNVLLTQSRFEEEGYLPRDRRYSQVNTKGAIAALETKSNGSGVYDNYRKDPRTVIGVYHWLPGLEVALLAEQEQSEALQGVRQSISINVVVTLGLVGLAVLAGLFVTRGIADPLANLAETATQIAAGDLDRTVTMKREDEIGKLGQAFNGMIAQVRDLVSGLEERVAQRTQDLERRSAYLEASAEVSQAAASILETDQLIRQVVELIRERFGLYYVGLFLVDELEEWAVLQAGTGEAGRAMLDRGHRIKVGEGMIGWSVANAQPRIALDVGEDAVRLATAELPETRSEAALPLRSRGRVLGALSVQSERPAAFDEDVLTVLQTMADEVAVALDNARLFAESQQALETAHRVYAELSGEAWVEYLRARPALGFRRDGGGISPVSMSTDGLDVPEDELSDPDTQLVRPIETRDRVIGMIRARKPDEAGEWTSEEKELLETLLGQLEVALDGARLYEETQRLAQRERLARQITERVRAAPDVETIAQIATEELVKALGGGRGFVKLSTKEFDQDGS